MINPAADTHFLVTSTPTMLPKPAPRFFLFVTPAMPKITTVKDNGCGEGEVQALHHAWILSLLTEGTTQGGRRFEIMSIDTDVWVAALLVYCVFPSTRNVRVVVRSQRGVGSTRACKHIDVLQVFEDITNLSHWSAEFTLFAGNCRLRPLRHGLYPHTTRHVRRVLSFREERRQLWVCTTPWRRQETRRSLRRLRGS